MINRRMVVRIGAVAVTAGLGLTACGGSKSASSSNASGSQLVGTFRLDAGACSGGGASGTFFRMIDPGGKIASGPFFQNPDSTCPDKTYTLAKPGTDGGIRTGGYQSNPTPPFTSTGSALADRIVAPQAFTAINFGIATNPVDPQAGLHVPAPQIELAGTSLSGQVEAWSAAWNNQYFNQGSPKPNGTRPGLTTPLSGTYDPTSHAFVITWSSQVVGGPFNGFTGYWHLQGTFVPSGAS
ncbi:MAG TPA: hypothetical protein VFZ97_19890 [Acidimicrobiales bacterium]